MIDQSQVIHFFNELAPTWDAGMVRNEAVIKEILDAAGIKKDISVLDIACGTGVLFPDYLRRGVKKVTGVDISPEMIRIAEEKFSDSRVTLLCKNAEEYRFPTEYDCCMIYNAFPHFSNAEKLLCNLSSALKPQGRLTIAHGMSRAAIDAHHSGSALHVSNGLLPAEKLAEVMSPWFSVDCILSDDYKYIISGEKRSDKI